jgi:Holliday junction resolvasome RuvABC endonuclease subunit
MEIRNDKIYYTNSQLIAPDGDFDSASVKITTEIANLLTWPFKLDVVLESGFCGRNIKSAMNLAEMRGAIKYACALADRTITEFNPGEVKKAATGKGNASKAEVREGIVRLVKEGKIIWTDKLDIIEDLNENIIDAIAIGYTYCAECLKGE